MERLSVWVSAGLLSAGVSAAVLAGAGVAVADDTTGGSDAGASSSPAPDTKPDPTSDTGTKPDTETGTGQEPAAEPETDAEPDLEPDGQSTPDTPTAEVPDAERAVPGKKKRPGASGLQATEPTEIAAESEPAAEVRTPPIVETIAEPAVSAPLVIGAKTAADRAATTARVAGPPAVSMAVAAQQPAVEQASAPRIPNLARWLQGLADSVVKGIGSLVINTIQALEALVTGPPAVPASSPVTVRTSTILLANGQRVQANWYFPDVAEGADPPDRLILLQHGFFALGPMYSHTAADLAVSTNSIVVTPTLSSNFFADDDAWLNGAGMWSNIADLFAGDRTALNDSARAAGFDGVLPEKFGLAGHSAGGQLVAAVAGYLVDNGAADNLVGVITLDGVPTGSVMSTALAKLQAYQDATGRYIPVREIGAPSNAFNSISNVKQALNAARPGRFNGVVLAGGVHMDSMRGGNPLIQFGAYLIAGFPKPQNQQAVKQLTTEWFNDWFAGDTDNGDELVPGSTIAISTPNGTATGVVVGSVPAVRMVTLAV
ncbi:alpha/beta hydrolase [Mycolicibacterium bacteremicum]|uniref:alpha/beta hydrolase n=1 Tax=Mycolicibacterium bacteremicum TaxID=564198 RepID=UPI0026F03DCA|nr:alpha/beta hydrolase [Mycolicibacterium bacteremicum]